jgi:hypothetical protein
MSLRPAGRLFHLIVVSSIGRHRQRLAASSCTSATVPLRSPRRAFWWMGFRAPAGSRQLPGAGRTGAGEGRPVNGPVTDLPAGPESESLPCAEEEAGLVVGDPGRHHRMVPGMQRLVAVPPDLRGEAPGGTGAATQGHGHDHQGASTVRVLPCRWPGDPRARPGGVECDQRPEPELPHHHSPPILMLLDTSIASYNIFRTKGPQGERPVAVPPAEDGAPGPGRQAVIKLSSLAGTAPDHACAPERPRPTCRRRRAAANAAPQSGPAGARHDSAGPPAGRGGPSARPGR